MNITCTLVPFPDRSNVVALGFLEGAKPLLLVSVGPTPMAAFWGMLAQAKFIQDATRFPLMPIGVN